jgi:hypothetical protein
VGGCGGGGKDPLPENYRLGLEGKGVDVNNSSRYRNEFGKNNKPLFLSKGKGRGEKTRNWIASFKRTGCIGCKDGNDSVHKGRDGKPVVIVVGDEAVTITVGNGCTSFCHQAAKFWLPVMCT